jgi:uncharacterized protein
LVETRKIQINNIQIHNPMQKGHEKTMKKTLSVNCPTCSKPVPWTDEFKNRPFCSERCQQIDLGAWASEEYAVPADQQDEWSLAEAVEEAQHEANTRALH